MPIDASFYSLKKRKSIIQLMSINFNFTKSMHERQRDNSTYRLKPDILYIKMNTYVFS